MIEDRDAGDRRELHAYADVYRERLPKGLSRAAEAAPPACPRRASSTCAPGGANDYIYMHIVTERMWDALLIGIGQARNSAWMSASARSQARARHWDACRRRFRMDDAAHQVRGDGVPRRMRGPRRRRLRQRGYPQRQAPARARQIRTIHHPIRGDVEMRAAHPHERFASGDAPRSAPRSAHRGRARTRTRPQSGRCLGTRGGGCRRRRTSSQQS